MFTNYLITGGSGFIGTHLLEFLLNLHNTGKIVILDLNVPKIQNPKIEYHQCDIREPINLKIDLDNAICVHLAALAKEPGYPWDDYFKTNFVGSQNVATFCAQLGINKIIFTSTMMVYRAGEIEYFEDSLTAPNTGYGLSKILAEKELEIWAQGNVNRHLCIIRPGVVYGLGENANMTRLFHAIKKNMFVYVGRKSTIKGIIYIKDLINLFNDLINERIEYGIYNFVYPDKYEIADIVNVIKKIFKMKRFIPILPFNLLLLVSYFFEFLNSLGLKNPIHHRRIEKLYYSTNISAQKIINAGFCFEFNLKTSFEDWKIESGGSNILK